MISIKDNLKDPSVDIWTIVNGKADEYIGHTDNAQQFHNIRLQIKEEKGLHQYGVYYKGQMIPIDKNGELKEWPNGLYDQVFEILMKLM